MICATELILNLLNDLMDGQDQIQDIIIEVLEQIRDRELKKCRVIEETIDLKNRMNQLEESYETY